MFLEFNVHFNSKVFPEVSTTSCKSTIVQSLCFRQSAANKHSHTHSHAAALRNCTPLQSKADWLTGGMTDKMMGLAKVSIESLLLKQQLKLYFNIFRTILILHIRLIYIIRHKVDGLVPLIYLTLCVQWTMALALWSHVDHFYCGRGKSRREGEGLQMQWRT